MLSEDYEQEQKDLTEKVKFLEAEISVQEETNNDIDRFIRKAKKHLHGTFELTPELLNAVITGKAA